MEQRVMHSIAKSVKSPILLQSIFLQNQQVLLGFIDEIDDLCYQTNTRAKDRKEGPLRGWFTAC